VTTIIQPSTLYTSMSHPLDATCSHDWRAEARANEEKERRAREAAFNNSNSLSTPLTSSSSTPHKFTVDGAKATAIALVFFDFLLMIFISVSYNKSYTHLWGRGCDNPDNNYALFTGDEFEYYMQPFNGVCEEKSTLSHGDCISWSDDEFWSDFSDRSKKLAHYADENNENLFLAALILGCMASFCHVALLLGKDSIVPCCALSSYFFGIVFYICCIISYSLLRKCTDPKQPIADDHHWEDFYGCDYVVSDRMEGFRLSSAIIAFGVLGFLYTFLFSAINLIPH